MNIKQGLLRILSIVVLTMTLSSSVFSQDTSTDNSNLEVLEAQLRTLLESNGYISNEVEFFLYNSLDLYPFMALDYILVEASNTDEYPKPQLAIAFYNGTSWEIRVKDIHQEAYNEFLNALPSEQYSNASKSFFAYTPELLTTQATKTGHYLPWQGGKAQAVTKRPINVNPTPKHDNYAWDFGLGNGTEIWSSYSGVVSRWVLDNYGPSKFLPPQGGWYCTPTSSPANYIVINNDDGTSSLYLHLKQGSIPDNLKQGTRVNRGDLVGQAGNVGYVCSKSNAPTAGAHLHFQVQTQSNSTWYSDTHNVIFNDPNWTAQLTHPVSGNYRNGNSCPASVEMNRLFWNEPQNGNMCKGSDHRWNYVLNTGQPHYFRIRRTNSSLEFDVLLKNSSGVWLYSSSSTNGVLDFPVTTGTGTFYLHVTSRNDTSGGYTMEIKQGVPGNNSLPFNFANAKGSLNWVGAGNFLRTNDFNDNGWRLNATALNDPYMISPPVNINANNNRYVAVNLRITGFPTNCSQPQLFFNKNTGESFAEGRSVKAPKITTQDVFQTIFFDMKSNSNWSGTVGRLRLDPIQCSGSPNNSWIRVRSIEVTNKGPITADFSVSSPPFEAGQPINFTSQVTGNPDELMWNWGDGTPNSTGATATHTYTTPGTYTITFTARHSLDVEGVGKVITVTEPVASCPTDVTNDGMTDVFDIQIIAGVFGAINGDPTYNPIHDIDGDGMITILDIQLAANNFGQSCV